MHAKWSESSSMDTVLPPRQNRMAPPDWSKTLQRGSANPLNEQPTGRSASRMSRLLSVMPAGVVVIDGEGRIQDCNPAAIKLLGEPLSGERWIDIIQRAFQPRPDDGHDVSLRDGRLVHISTNPLEGEPGQIVLLHDVTETRQLQHKVSHMQRLSAMGEVAARLAHQIRTPLSSAMLYLSPLLKANGETATQRRFAERLHDSLSHMEQLVRNMLAFSKGDMAAPAPVNIDALFEEVARQFYSSASQDGCQLTVSNNTNDGHIFGSQPALVSAINNLINNAREACRDDGKISLSADFIEDEQQQQFIEISIEDNGIGIEEADFDKILQPFYTTRSAGTGLGLAVVQSIIKAHKGIMWLDSDLGEGSTFCLRLPVYRANQPVSRSVTAGAMS